MGREPNAMEEVEHIGANLGKLTGITHQTFQKTKARMALTMAKPKLSKGMQRAEWVSMFLIKQNIKRDVGSTTRVPTIQVDKRRPGQEDYPPKHSCHPKIAKGLRRLSGKKKSCGKWPRLLHSDRPQKWPTSSWSAELIYIVVEITTSV